MANPLVIEGYIGAMAPLLFWDGQSVIIHICPFCGYWPINGEETKPVCVRCKEQPTLVSEEMPDVYRMASGQQWLTPYILKRRKV